MRTFSCQSGSNGNCFFVEAGDTRLLIDAGISGKQAQLRMARHQQPARVVDALVVSHDHGDHSSCAGIYQRKFGVPIYATRGTARACKRRWAQVHDVREFAAGDSFQVGTATVHTLATPHDAVDGACFVVEHAGLRLGILTDLGHPFAGLRRLLPTLDGVYLESNYDPDMLANGPYPYYLKRRISGRRGHLANDEAAVLLRDAARKGRLRWAVLSHLSEENNSPKVALKTARQIVGPDLALHVASRHVVSDAWEL
jgi:phosphoribosyl 1,2-cyclic phosphodiesterase